MALNVNELILDRVKEITYSELGTGKLMMRLKSPEDVSLNCTAEGDEVTDAVGSPITTIYRAKKATLSGSNSLISMDLAAIQYGTEKKIASSSNKITDIMFEILTIEGGKVTLKNTPKDAVKYIYSISNNEIAKAYEAGSAATATEFLINGKVITVPTGLTGKVYVEYTYETDSAVQVDNTTAGMPKAGQVVVYAYFKDVCNENLTYYGKVICPKAKIDPSSVELALNSTGKHPFTFQMMKDYCSEDENLFSIIVAE